ncbi:MAG: hypothetical protein ACRCYY_12420 [Trueperaceae bacterium]
MVRITYTQSPGVKNPHLIEDLLEMVRNGKQGCVDGVVKMIADLHESGSGCRYLKALGGGLLELKTRTPTGGARVYLFQGGEGEYVLCRAECKRETKANTTLLEHTAEEFVKHQEKAKKAKVKDEKATDKEDSKQKKGKRKRRDR